MAAMIAAGMIAAGGTGTAFAATPAPSHIVFAADGGGSNGNNNGSNSNNGSSSKSSS
jgi:hypothetical protein